MEDGLSKTSRDVFSGRVVRGGESGECSQYFATVVAITMFHDRAELGFELRWFLMDINLCDLDS